jgi:hypothetical protein
LVTDPDGGLTPQQTDHRSQDNVDFDFDIDCPVRLDLSKGPNRVGVLPSPEDGNRLFPKRCAFCYFELRTMDKVQKTSDSECCTPLSEPFGFLLKLYIPVTQTVEAHEVVIHRDFHSFSAIVT